jgi:16S rRNA (cytosine1402-N4)-methyltransferase
MHIPVMRETVLEYLAPRPGGVYLDATAGMLGHAGAIAARLSTGMVIACDRDADSLEIARRHAVEFAGRIRLERAAFSELPAVLARGGVSKVGGLVAAHGARRYHLAAAGRGFYFISDGALDMRMDRSQRRTADEIVNTTAEKALADLIYEFGQERRARKIARAIVRARPITSTLHLARVVERAAPRTGRLHPATQTFMALRIAVNGEMEELDALLKLAPDLVGSGGRIVIISFMSLEDTRVKRAFQGLAREGRAVILTKHVVRPSDEEVRANRASRSAKRRAIPVA